MDGRGTASGFREEHFVVCRGFTEPWLLDDDFRFIKGVRFCVRGSLMLKCLSRTGLSGGRSFCIDNLFCCGDDGMAGRQTRMRFKDLQHFAA